MRPLYWAVAVLPEPVEAGELAVAGVESRDVVARVVPLHVCKDIRMQLRAHVKGQIDGVVRHPVRLMRGNSHNYLAQDLSSVTFLSLESRRVHKYELAKVTRRATRIIQQRLRSRIPSK